MDTDKGYSIKTQQKADSVRKTGIQEDSCIGISPKNAPRPHSLPLSFRLDIAPVAQMRARHGRTRNGLHVTYRHPTQQANDRALQALLAPYAPRTPANGPLVLEFIAGLPVARTDSKRAAEAKLSGVLPPIKRPDIDNLAKELMDCMTRMRFWDDDDQIQQLHCSKIYARSACWLITLRPFMPRDHEQLAAQLDTLNIQGDA